jgi:predicted MPP superfamily phosphohydrolase
MKIVKKRYFKVLSILLVLFALILSNILIEVWITKLERVTIDTNKLEEGKSIKILQITDVHNKKSMNSNKQLVSLVKKAQPDIIAITGDLIDDDTINLDSVYRLIEQIIEINPKVYYVTGNHEWRGGLASELKEGLKARGVIVLENKNEVININGSTISICGVEDWTSGLKDFEAAVQGIDSENFVLMLAHDPWIIYDYDKFMPDLTLSGHTHGGQIRLPLIGAVVAPGQKLFPELDKGIYELDKDKLLYIDSGVGTSVFPVRFLNQSQVTLITIE